MNCSLCLAAATLFLTGCGALAVDQRIVYDPDDGVVLTRTHRSSWEASRAGSSSERDDWTSDERIVVTDHLLEVEGGRPLELSRTFTDLASRSWWSFGGSEGDVRVLTSELDGKTVHITWDDDEGTYRFAATEGHEIDDARLAALVEDMDYRRFLPPDGVRPGDEWALDVDAYRAIAWAGGVLNFVDLDYLEDDFETRYQAASHAAQQATGTARFEGVLSTEDARVAVITFRFETSAEFAVLGHYEEPGGAQRAYRRSGSVRGELRWNLDHHHLHSVTADSERESVSFVRHPGDPGESGKQVFEGHAHFAVTVERGGS